MKTHEIAKQLDLLAKLLRSLPNAEMNESLSRNLQASLPGIDSSQSKSVPKKVRPLLEGFENQLVGKSPAEIEKLLSSEEEGLTVSHLSELAKRLKIPASKRQNRHALINQITRHFEAEQMHLLIRNNK